MRRVRTGAVAALTVALILAAGAWAAVAGWRFAPVDGRRAAAARVAHAQLVRCLERNDWQPVACHG